MKNIDYFPHESEARNSPKLLSLRTKEGAIGYGVYFMILERLCKEPDYTSIRDYDMLAFDFHVKSDLVKSVVKEFGLFQFTEDGKRFYSEGFKRRVEFKRKRMYSVNVNEWHRIAHLVFQRDNYTCQYCGKIGGILEVDHITPFSKGGSDELSNLTTSCRRCNRQKKDKTIQEFIVWRNKHGTTNKARS